MGIDLPSELKKYGVAENSICLPESPTHQDISCQDLIGGVRPDCGGLNRVSVDSVVKYEGQALLSIIEFWSGIDFTHVPV